MTNHQCYCYGIVAIYNILNDKFPITSDLFFDEMYYLWDLYSEDEIEKLYNKMEKEGKFKKLDNIKLKDWQ